jgi:hypothetical protein
MDQQSVMEPAQSSLGGLGFDVLVMIVDYLQKDDIASLRLVNSYLNKICEHVFYRDMPVNFLNGFVMLSQRLLWLEQHMYLPSVRSLKIAVVRQRVVRLPSKVSHKQQRNEDAISVSRSNFSVDIYHK